MAAHGIYVAVRGLLSSCGLWAPEHMGYSFGAQAPERVGSVVAACGLSSCGVWA